MGRLDNKVALVTGASRGIGRAVVLAFAQEGAKPVFCARSERELAELAKQLESLGANCFWSSLDISRKEAVDRFVAEAVKSMGRIDVLVNNAAVLGPRVEMSQLPYEDWKSVLGVNADGAFLITQAVLNSAMLKQSSGCIINVISGVGRRAKPRWGAYAVSKFALEGLSQTWAAELEPKGIRVVSLNPGLTRTALRREAEPQEDPETLKTPDAAAHAFVAIAADESGRFQNRSFDLTPSGELVEYKPA
ncbi:MAG: SDR family oxidoreductase [Elusimicrobia bacterium]|nr:SDR family oxidoreductase [Elusimicrobiota bacterium]